MNPKALYFILIMAVSLLLIPVLDARGGGGRGGGGGGGRGGGGGGRVSQGGGGRSLQRSPSMSRTSNPHPVARQAASPRPTSRPVQNRPTGSQLNQRADGRAQTRNEVQNFLQHQQGTRPGERAGQVVSRQDQRSIRTPAERHDFGQNVRREIVRDRVNSGNWFNDNFWNQHNYFPSYYTHDLNWWGWGSAVGVSSWLGWQTVPVYYDYSYGNDGYWRPVESGSSQAYSNMAQPAESTSTLASSSGEWMPLGVFGLSREGSTGTMTTPNIYMQLALSKQGFITGTYYNATTDQTYEVGGEVDKRTQRAAWKVVEGTNAPFIEAGIYNLTQSEAPARVYFPDGTTQQMLLIRLEEQKA